MDRYELNMIFTTRHLSDLEKRLADINNEENIYSLTSSDTPNLLINGNPV